MDKKVLLTINGLHQDGEAEHGSVETVVAAEYFKRNDSHYLIYEEMQEGFEQTSKTRIKCKEHMVELTRQGLLTTHMVFEQGKEHITPYATPYGQMLLGINTKSVQLVEQKDSIRVLVEYSLTSEGELISDSHIEIIVREQT
ncbi:MAG: DUF1934 domain-containing protein [Lachnospiraceae bacterium]|nr:DUF1934 domain-containing protein [Lachnospiraceae bacterium]